jgi:Asp-tRNA(Asn)/Glu-tRNA(Gln) amidotransferase A subunit family amidase
MSRFGGGGLRTAVNLLQLHRDLETGHMTSRQLVATYLARIAALNQPGPHLGAVISTNPEAKS